MRWRTMRPVGNTWEGNESDSLSECVRECWLRFSESPHVSEGWHLIKIDVL